MGKLFEFGDIIKTKQHAGVLYLVVHRGPDVNDAGAAFRLVRLASVGETKLPCLCSGDVWITEAALVNDEFYSTGINTNKNFKSIFSLLQEKE